jgi:Skp family chaperone for outer membrane proteins
MNFRFKIAAAVLVAVSVASCYGQTSEAQPPVKKHIATKKAKTPPPPTVAEQIQALRQELEGQINGLKTDLATKDAQLQKAQQAAAEAQAAADKASAAAGAQQQAVTDNASAVTTLQTTVNDLKGNQVSLATTVSDETAKIKKDIANPSVLHYKGIGLTPGGYLAGETVWRSKATGGDIPTAFSAIPYEGADAYSLSEFFGSARQSRITLMAEGKTSWGILRGYYEADWLGTGITSNNNQSNSYVLRQRVLWGQAETNSHWAFTGGQLWSLATEDKKGISNLSGDIMTPQTIDPNYVAGFVWTRQFGFRVTKSFNHAAFGIAAENPQLLYSAALAGSTPYAVLGSAGANGGNYNAAISGLSGLTTYVQSYTGVNTQTSTGATVYNYIRNYNTISANSNIANLSFNQAPDIIVKAAFDPGFGHYEVFGIAGFAHETVYPGVTQNSVKYGGITDIQGFSGAAPGSAVWAKSSTAGYYSDSIMLGGFGASLRVPVIKDKLTFGAKGLYGPGMGRYGDTTLSDVTNDAAGELAPIHNLSGLLTVEANPTPRLMIYLNYGGDYAGRTDFASSAVTLGDPTATFCESTVNGVALSAANAATYCSAKPTAAMFANGGNWGSHFTTTPAITAVGYGSRYASVSATCATVANPGLASGSVGFQPGGTGCGNNTRDVQEVTGGYWYDIYKGDHGRLRQSIQYGYAVREGWSGTGTAGALSAPLNGAKGIDNMFWTSFRYYLP